MPGTTGDTSKKWVTSVAEIARPVFVRALASDNSGLIPAPSILKRSEQRISTPWVAGSNPAGIANDFKGMGVLAGLFSCCGL